MRSRTLLAAALVAVAIPTAPAAAATLEPGRVLHHVQVQSMAGDRHHEVETTRSSTVHHRVVRDLDRGGRIVREELVDTRSGRLTTYDGRRGVRYDRTCDAVARTWFAAASKPAEVTADKIASGEYAVVGRRQQFGRTVLDLTGDIGEPDVGPQRIDLTVDEATSTTLAAKTGRGGHVSTTAFSVKAGRASTALSADARKARVRTKRCP